MGAGGITTEVPPISSHCTLLISLNTYLTHVVVGAFLTLISVTFYCLLTAYATLNLMNYYKERRYVIVWQEGEGICSCIL